MAEHELKLTRGAVNLLESSLMQPGWAKDAKSLYNAGALIEKIDGMFGEDKMPRLKPSEEGKPPSNDEIEVHNDKVETWALRDVELTLTESERETCKKCINEAVSGGNIAPTKHFMSLCDQLGLID